MTTPFGPQLIGETEKTLNALLRGFLADTGLSEPQWVTLRIASTLDGTDSGLASAARERAHFEDSDEIVSELTERGLLAEDRLTGAGRDLLAQMQATIAEATRPIWEGLPESDVAAATRVLNEVATRARSVLDSH